MLFGGQRERRTLGAVAGHAGGDLLAGPPGGVVVRDGSQDRKGLAGIAAVINLLSSAGERYWVVTDGVQTTLVALSTIAYPIATISAYLPSPLVSVVELNPLSQGAEALRAVVQGAPASPAFNLIALFATSAALLCVGVVSYRRVFTKLREVGKI